uniref:(northern house mosquito) hypothetical protein n=1 Tax=Culex pipiens TaxID=7175 RepID=A0A8D8EZW8_CULPI
MRDHIDQFVPKVRKRVTYHLPWQTPELRNLKTQKRAAFKVSSRCGTLSLRDYYLSINSRYQRLSRSCMASYQRRKQRELKSNPKKFWKFVDENRKESGLPSSLHLADEEAESTERTCNRRRGPICCRQRSSLRPLSCFDRN